MDWEVQWPSLFSSPFPSTIPPPSPPPPLPNKYPPPPPVLLGLLLRRPRLRALQEPLKFTYKGREGKRSCFKCLDTFAQYSNGVYGCLGWTFQVGWFLRGGDTYRELGAHYWSQVERELVLFSEHATAQVVVGLVEYPRLEGPG